ncbi:hypothetical protein ABTY96_03285 [Streptomyces sp. NPDC096057]|uniref:hypothetical protein n=1 Tax=Streptomyces sp. NPDC096057 TaxID=3155543 RepID=UPI00332C6547
MSAWAELVNHDGSDEWLDLCNRALLEVQQETTRRNAARIQAAREETRATDWGRSSRSKRPYLQGMERAQRTVMKTTEENT